MTYSQGKPGKVSNDDYKYHLKHLVNQGLIEKQGKVYSLTQKGKIAAMHLDAKGVQQEKFWVHVSCYVEDKARNVLLQKKLKHPYFGDVFGIAGKVHQGETIELAASRKLFEESGLICKFKTIGTVRRIRRNTSSDILQDAFFYVCFGKNPTGKLVKKNVFGENFWCTYSEAINFHENNYTAGPKSTEVLKRLKQRNLKPFFFHEEISLGTPLP